MEAKQKEKSTVVSAETWAVTKAQEKMLEVVKMTMLQWTCLITRRFSARNEKLRGR